MDELIKLRDSFAHGRVFISVSSDKNVSLLLLIFEDPKKVNIQGKTKVRFVKEMTLTWLDEQIRWTHREQSKIQKAEEMIKILKP
jgi:hypothetical protein